MHGFEMPAVKYNTCKYLLYICERISKTTEKKRLCLYTVEWPVPFGNAHKQSCTDSLLLNRIDNCRRRNWSP